MTVAVVSKLKTDQVTVTNKGVKLVSSVDLRISVTAPKGAVRFNKTMELKVRIYFYLSSSLQWPTSRLLGPFITEAGWKVTNGIEIVSTLDTKVLAMLKGLTQKVFTHFMGDTYSFYLFGGVSKNFRTCETHFYTPSSL